MIASSAKAATILYMLRGVFFVMGGATIVAAAFTLTLSVVDRGFGGTFNAVLHYISP
jgi:hypothetical protein